MNTIHKIKYIRQNIELLKSLLLITTCVETYYELKAKLLEFEAQLKKMTKQLKFLWNNPNSYITRGKQDERNWGM